MSYEGRHKFRAFRKDRNHAEIKLALVTAQLDFIDAAAYGFPCDFLVFHDGRTYWLEVKDPDKPPSQHELTDDEKELEKKLNRNKCKLYVVQTPEDVLDIFCPQPRPAPDTLRIWK